MQFAKLRLALPLIVCGLAASDAAEVQETGAEGIFYGRGLVKAVEPGTGWVTLAHNDIMGCMPAMEMMFRVRAPEVSRELRLGDTIDFTLDGGKIRHPRRKAGFARRVTAKLRQRKLARTPTKSRPSAFDTAWWQDMQLDGGSCM